MPQEIVSVIIVTAIFGSFLLIMFITDLKTLNIKSKTVGDGQHGTARFASPKEIHQTFKHVPYSPNVWRKSNPNGLPQGIVLGCNTALKKDKKERKENHFSLRLRLPARENLEKLKEAFPRGYNGNCR